MSCRIVLAKYLAIDESIGNHVVIKACPVKVRGRNRDDAEAVLMYRKAGTGEEVK